MTNFNERIIEEFNANNGRVDSAGFGTSLVLLHTIGAKTGTPRTNPAMSLRDGEDWLVVGSAMGAPHDPAWVANLRANADIEIQAVIGGSAERVPVTATELKGDARDTAFARFVERAPAFAAYQDKAPRQLPVIKLTRRAAQHSTVPPVAPDDPQRTLAVRRPETDASLPHLGVVGDNYTILLTGADTAGRYALIDMHIPPGGGPPPHRHDFEEMFHVLDGEFEMTFRGEKHTIRAGETINVPARAPHFFHNAGDAPARVLCMVTPPGLEEYFTRWGQPLPDRTSPPDQTEAETRRALDIAIELGPQYAIENLPPENETSGPDPEQKDGRDGAATADRAENKAGEEREAEPQ
ncbi:nitroreductase/quinone reductase family protein [Luteipulveratus halotolerans]|uniref:nitroreductase/quinone reductase family protein n=1 Tax=Luteipulveratus halotolerans TaxID=1631356 RepID=UPI0008FBFDBE|nr:nitroreductase/quinone reductase family protein [Luteipulveratus halotolerans]